MRSYLSKNWPKAGLIGLLMICAFVMLFLSGCDSTGISFEDSKPELSSKHEYKSESDNDLDNSLVSDSNLYEEGVYTTKEEVALYIHQYGKLPSNFITKQQAQELGWNGGSLEPYAPGKCIGGNNFGNYEGLLPSEKGRKYKECDIDTLEATSRGAKRIVYSNDGLIYYTDNHYESFTLLYGGQ